MHPKSKRITLLTGGVKTRRRLKGMDTDALSADEYSIDKKDISDKLIKIRLKKRKR